MCGLASNYIRRQPQPESDLSKILWIVYMKIVIGSSRPLFQEGNMMIQIRVSKTSVKPFVMDVELEHI
jgi:hypothetical protein